MIEFDWNKSVKLLIRWNWLESINIWMNSAGNALFIRIDLNELELIRIGHWRRSLLAPSRQWNVPLLRLSIAQITIRHPLASTSFAYGNIQFIINSIKLNESSSINRFKVCQWINPINLIKSNQIQINWFKD